MSLLSPESSDENIFSSTQLSAEQLQPWNDVKLDGLCRFYTDRFRALDITDGPILSMSALSRSFRRLLAYHIGHQRAGEVALSAGVGSGIVEERLISRYGMRIIGFDITPSLLWRAQQKGVEAVLGDAATLTSVPDNSIDQFLLLESLGHMDTDRVLKEAHRVLKPSGHIYVTTYANARITANSYKPHTSTELCELLGRHNFREIEDRSAEAAGCDPEHAHVFHQAGYVYEVGKKPL